MTRSLLSPDGRPAQEGHLPNLIILGAEKCGTTSLHYYLNQHPQIFMSAEKELNFFVREKNWPKGTDWYKSQFRGNAYIYGESSPSYTFYPYFQGVPERMHRLLKDPKLIYLVRDPLERIVSSYMHTYAMGFEQRRFPEILATFEKNAYVCRSRYFMQLAQYLRFFRRQNILLITTERLLSHRRETLRHVFEFLGVDESFESTKFSSERNKSKDRRKKNKVGRCLALVIDNPGLRRLSPDLAWHLDRLICLPFSSTIERPSLDGELRLKLAEHFRDDLHQLREFANQDFPEWSV